MDELPIGTVTVLFTHIEGSTRLLKQWRERYAEALADHQRILRDAFVEHDGHDIDTQGDSFLVAFRRAKSLLTSAGCWEDEANAPCDAGPRRRSLTA